LAVTVTDEGELFNPFRGEAPDTHTSLKEREIGGLGIHLARSVMDRVSHRRVAGRNVVTLLKHLPDVTGMNAAEAKHNE
jgi:anti-sigma regulatory factor (Ser/Thr protein kinase)